MSLTAVVDKPCPPKLRDHVVPVVLWNQLVSLPYFYCVAYLLLQTSWSAHLLVKLVVAPVLLDFSFYGLHRLAHTQRFWKYHALHHTLKGTMHAPAAAFCSTVEHLGVNLLSGTIPVLVLGFTPLETAIWIALGTIDVVFSHSAVSSGHDRHHAKPTCRFGSTLGLADRVFGTL